jgi:hypothetical protein
LDNATNLRQQIEKEKSNEKKYFQICLGEIARGRSFLNRRSSMAILQSLSLRFRHVHYLSCSPAQNRRRLQAHIKGFLSVILLANLATPIITFAQVELFSPIEPFGGIRYGMGYDTSAQAAAKGGQPCVDFDPKKTHSMGDGKQDNDWKEYSRSSDIVKQMNLSADAQVKALGGTYEANATLDVANKTEVHKYSQTWLYRRYLRNDTIYLFTEEVSLKPEYKPLFSKGIQGLDEFRARCGNAFVVGQQTSAYYFGTAYKSVAKAVTSSDLNATFSFKYRGAVNADAAAKLSIKQKQEEETKEYEVKNSSSDLSLPPPANKEALEKQFQEFTVKEGSVGKLVEARIAPYTVVKGVPPDSILGKSTEQAKLQILLDALWDLKTLKEQARYILVKEKGFALGIPGGKKRQLRLANVRSLLERWQGEFEKLFKDVKDCISSYNENCTKLANTYEANPKIAEESLLPQKYKSYCYGNIEVRQQPGGISSDASDDRIALQHGRRGDAEMNSGPVNVAGLLHLVVDGTQLKAKYEVRLEENKGDHSQFYATSDFVVFDLNPPDFGDYFKECEFNANFPVKESRIKQSRHNGQRPPPAKADPALRNVYGIITATSGRNPPHDKYQKFAAAPNSGVLRSVDCILDTGGNDNGKLFCKPPELNNLHINLVNRLDLEAEKWQPTPKKGVGIGGELSPKIGPTKRP